MIALFTDFGIQGPYLGQMRAVLYLQAPDVPVVDIFPDLPPFDTQSAASLLPAYSQFLPASTLCLCVVDPGVGSDRRGLIVEAGGRRYVGPDNGLFSLLLETYPDARCREIRWQPAHLSRTFHGRDWFAPVAARLARGEDVESVPLQPEELVMPGWQVDCARVVYIDAYGNAITGYRASRLGAGTRITVGDHEISQAGTFSDVPTGVGFWYENSNGLVEIAVNQGSAATSLQLAVGSRFSISAH